MKVFMKPWCGLDEDAAKDLVAEMAEVARAHHRRTRGELVEALGDVVTPATKDGAHLKAQKAAAKLILDRCDFEMRDDVDPGALRLGLFQAAAEARRSHPEGALDREAVVAAVAPLHNLDAPQVEDVLYADLEDARLVDATELMHLDVDELMARWTLGEHQALLLRSTRVVADIQARPADLRSLLRFMKMLQLLFEVHVVEGGRAKSEGVRLVVEGPMTLFSSSTRYGMKLAMLLPRLQRCDRVRLDAEVRLARGGKPIHHLWSHDRSTVDAQEGTDGKLDAGSVSTGPDVDDDESPLLRQLRTELRGLLRDHDVVDGRELVSIPGVGACVPDLVVSDAQGRRCLVEILGFWSRDAVWQRVAMARTGLATPMVFCVSERLRVSEAALDDDDDATLVRFKGSLSARKVADAVVTQLSRLGTSVVAAVPVDSPKAAKQTTKQTTKKAAKKTTAKKTTAKKTATTETGTTKKAVRRPKAAPQEPDAAKEVSSISEASSSSTET